MTYGLRMQLHPLGHLPVSSFLAFNGVLPIHFVFAPLHRSACLKIEVLPDLADSYAAPFSQRTSWFRGLATGTISAESGCHQMEDSRCAIIHFRDMVTQPKHL